MYEIRLRILEDRKVVKSYAKRECDECGSVIDIGEIYLRCGPKTLCVRCYLSRYPEERELVLRVLKKKYPEAYRRMCEKFPELCLDDHKV
jgi:hypothetical protein